MVELKMGLIQQFAEDILAIEAQWYTREAEDAVLKKRLVQWLSSSDIQKVIDAAVDSADAVDIEDIEDTEDTEDTDDAEDVKDEKVIKNVIENILVIDEKINLKYFVRSYKSALKEIIAGSFDSKDSKKTINKKIKNKFKSIVELKIGNVSISIKPNPSNSHLGNGYITDIGAYADIWPMLNLITDCDKANNAMLADKFLMFSVTPKEFKKNDLININKKFEFFDDNSVNYYCKFLTGIAFLYVFYESARRFSILDFEEQDVVFSEKIPCAASMIMILKLVRDQSITKLEEAFSPTSQYMLFTRKNVKNLSNKIIQEATTKIAESTLNRIFAKTEKNTIKRTDVVRYVLHPDSDEFNLEDTPEYEGDDIQLKEKPKKIKKSAKQNKNEKANDKEVKKKVLVKGKN